MNYHHYQQLKGKERDAYKKIVSAVSHLENTVRIPSLSDNNAETLSGIISAIKYDHPEFFYLDCKNIIFWKKAGELKIDINYAQTKENIIEKKRLYKRKALKIIKKELKINRFDSDYKKLKLLHDYMVRNTVYWEAAKGNAENFPQAYTIEGFFTSGKGVCSGISKTFKWLCDLCNVETFIVSGQSVHKDGKLGNHSWNIVRLGRKFYHCDITWDICMSESCRHTRYDYFCIPDPWLFQDHRMDDLKISCPYHDRSYFTQNKCLLSTGGRHFERAVLNAVKDHPDFVYFKVKPSVRKKKMIDKAYKQLRAVLRKSEIYAHKSFTTTLYPNREQGIIFCRISSA